MNDVETTDLRGGVTQITTPSGSTGYTHDSAYTGLNLGYVRTELSGMRWSYAMDKLRRLTQEKKEAVGPALGAAKSELFTAYAITLDADRASSAATNHALQLAATDLEYEVTRVKSPVLGRDLNPLGRGDGTYYANGGNVMGGSVAIRRTKTRLVGVIALGFGNSVNNQSWPPTPPPFEGYSPERAECHEATYGTGVCSPELDASEAESCCNPQKIAEAWKAMFYGYGLYRSICGEEYPAGTVPPEGSMCYKLGVLWMTWCMWCITGGEEGEEPPRPDWDCDYIKRACDRIYMVEAVNNAECLAGLGDHSHYGRAQSIALVAQYHRVSRDARSKARGRWEEEGCRALMSVGAAGLDPPKPQLCKGFAEWCMLVAKDYAYGLELCKRYSYCCPGG